VALLVTYLIRLQGVLPFNPQHRPAVTPAPAWSTSVSFVTNINWQAYSGETTIPIC
jgi:potassium-transporting ATPase potassium-binding subunit